jgi:hypothetical protein
MDEEQSLGNSVRPKRQRNWSLRLIGLGALIVLLGFLGFAVFDSYVFAVGTPTTAKIEHCTNGFHLSKPKYSTGKASWGYAYRVINAVVFPSEGCTGTWDVHGVKSSGRIIGGDVYDYTGGDPRVRIYGGNAYTTGSLENSFGVIVLIVVLAGSIVWFVWMLRRYTRRQ